MQPDIRGPISLNKDHRRRELVRITRENHHFLKRIQQAQPVYNHVQWEEGFRQSQSYLRVACERPLVLKGRRSTLTRSRYAKRRRRTGRSPHAVSLANLASSA